VKEAIVKETARRSYLVSMGIDLWEARDSVAPDCAGHGGAAAEAGRSPCADEDRTTADTGMDWDELKARVAKCSLCALHESRTGTVFGAGDRHAQWMIIGEAPGADEDRQGEPFVGRAGRLLNEMLRAIGLERGQVYITNILKCRPPGNRDPRPEEITRCDPYLRRQMELLQPRIILAVGRISAQVLLHTDRPLSRLRGRVHRHEGSGTPLIVTYHPAYLLRSPAEKRRAWDDLLLARNTFRSLRGAKA
jgi:uracil-DNA glycosylase family 4